MQKHHCYDGHEEHLCKRIIGDLWYGVTDIEKVKPLVNNPKYICTYCARAANKEENLCAPTLL